MTDVIMIHGTFGNPEENWFPWLKSELEKLGCRVFAPRFPTPEGQSLQNWMKVFRDYERYMGDHTIVVGHSIGPAFLLTVLESHKAKAAFFVAGFTGNVNNPKFDPLNGTIADRNFDWKRIRGNCGRFCLFYSDNDPYVPQEKIMELGNNLGITPTLVKGAGHFNEKAGYTRFGELLEGIKKEL